MQLCALTLAGHQVPTKGTLSLPSSATENTMESSWAEKGRDHSELQPWVKQKTWAKLI